MGQILSELTDNELDMLILVSMAMTDRSEPVETLSECEEQFWQAVGEEGRQERERREEEVRELETLYFRS
jgi:hypothetical protein